MSLQDLWLAPNRRTQGISHCHYSWNNRENRSSDVCSFRSRGRRPRSGGTPHKADLLNQFLNQDTGGSRIYQWPVLALRPATNAAEAACTLRAVSGTEALHCRLASAPLVRIENLAKIYRSGEKDLVIFQDLDAQSPKASRSPSSVKAAPEKVRFCT